MRYIGKGIWERGKNWSSQICVKGRHLLKDHVHWPKQIVFPRQLTEPTGLKGSSGWVAGVAWQFSTPVNPPGTRHNSMDISPVTSCCFFGEQLFFQGKEKNCFSSVPHCNILPVAKHWLHHPISHSPSLGSQSLLGSPGTCIPSAHKKLFASQSYVQQGLAWLVLIAMIWVQTMSAKCSHALQAQMSWEVFLCFHPGSAQFIHLSSTCSTSLKGRNRSSAPTGKME